MSICPRLCGALSALSIISSHHLIVSFARGLCAALLAEMNAPMEPEQLQATFEALHAYRESTQPVAGVISMLVRLAQLDGETREKGQRAGAMLVLSKGIERYRHAVWRRTRCAQCDAPQELHALHIGLLHRGTHLLRCTSDLRALCPHCALADGGGCSSL